MSTDDVIAAVFGRAADGHLAARVEDIAFIAIPVKDGFRIATGWRLTRPIDQWTATDAFGASAIVADEEGFRAHVEENAEHRRHLRTLGRSSDEHTSELQSLMRNSYAVFCLKKNTTKH